MPVDRSSTLEPGNQLATFAADLTDAAYSVALRHGIAGSWIDLQLDVWQVLARTITEARPESFPPDSATEFNAWRDAFLSELTEAAYHTALRHRLQGPFLDFELDLHQTLQRVVERPESETGLRRMFGARARVVADAVLSRLDRHHPRCQPSNPAARQASCDYW
jgi:hypothetical protein